MNVPSSAPLPLRAGAFGLDAPEEPIELIQTHIGWVYLARSHAFKLKKHVKFDFLDFTTLEQRRWACEREIALNARLCPDLYLGLRAVRRDANGGVRVDPALTLPVDKEEAGTGAGEIVDWAVWMRRLPLERMLDRLLQENKVTATDCEAIADVLAPFYMKQRGAISPGGLGDFEAVRGNVEENLREGAAVDTSVLAPEALRLIATRAHGYLKRHGDVIRQRAKDGFVVDGHGDLRAENVCLPLPVGAPPLLFDCIEFNDRFRVIDSCLDAAFLAMDLDSRGREDLSAAFLNRYRYACDPNLPPDLLDFYLGYRAFVKGKVAAWIMADKDVPPAQREFSRTQARALFDLAVRYALRRKPVLIVCCGVAGSGKSTLARELAARLKCEHIASDVVRDEVVPRGRPPAERYTQAASMRVYQILYEGAARALSEKRTVILDGTFTRKEVRQRAVTAAKSANAYAIVIHAACTPENIEAHMHQREAARDAFGSEADPAVAREQLAGFETPTVSECDALCRIDTNGSLETAREQAWRQVTGSLATFFK
jgi:aminoglycoside phosphotransferase family enzyme/predicted kinase